MIEIDNKIYNVVDLLGEGMIMLLIAASPIILILSVRYMYKKSVKTE